MYEYYEMYAGYLKHLVMMECALEYLNKMGALKNVHKGTVEEMLGLVTDIQKDLVPLKKHIHTVSSFCDNVFEMALASHSNHHSFQISIKSTKNPLYIAPAKHQTRSVLKPILKYSLIVGVGIYLGCKLVKLIH